MARDSFIFYRSFYEAIDEIPEQNQAEVYRAIMRYALNQEEYELEGISKAIFSLVKPQLDANYRKYENGKQKGSKVETKQKQNRSKSKANVNDNVNENENDNDNDNAVVNNNKSNMIIKAINNINKESDSCVDGLRKVIDFYNNNIGQLTPFGLSVLESYKDEFSEDVIIYAMQKSVEADKRTIQYIKAILNNWSKKGIKNLVEAQKESASFRKKDAEKSTNGNKRTYSEDDFMNLYAN